MPREEVRFGSQGEGVRELQKYLNKIGGGKYYLKEDGIFGDETLNVVRDFQKNNGLTVDGIVGFNTWTALTGANTANNTTTSNEAFKYDDFTYGDFNYNKYQESDTVKEAEAALNAQLSQKPGEYKSQWQAQLDDTINKILNREKFSYDLNGDALYQQYKDKYTQQAKMAMGDAIGQASAMTGGYGNSYAQSVGQQQYQKEMQNLNDIVPELYQMAYDKYNQEGQDLYNQYSMLGAQEDQDYGRYRDSVSDWRSERDYLAGRYDSERNLDYSMFDNERNFAYGQYADDRNFAYGQYSDDKSYAYNEYRNAIEDALAKEQFEYQKNRDAISDEQWQKEFDARYGNKSGDTPNDTSPTYKPPMVNTTPEVNNTPTKDDVADEKAKYADWDASDWNSYFAQIRISEGKSAAEEELRYFTSKGLIPKNMVSPAAIGARGRLGR